MALRVVGAGVGRTGTHSLKVALEQLLGQPCYHMVEVFSRPGDVAQWHAAGLGQPVDWEALMDGFAAAVDWPASACWRELADANPDAIVLLSTRDSAEQWYESARRTIFERIEEIEEGNEAWHAMVDDLIFGRFGARPKDREGCLAAYDRHNAAVRAEIDPDRLVEWKPQDGWGPLCRALDVPEPAEPFPVTNTTSEFRARAGWD